jgi:hypothetical protein
LSAAKAKTDWIRSHLVVKAAAPKPIGRRRAARPRATARQATLPSRKVDAVLAPNQNIENNPMQSNRGSLAWMLYPRKHFDTSGKSAALLRRRAICKTPLSLPNNRLFGAISGKKSFPTIEVAPARHSE